MPAYIPPVAVSQNFVQSSCAKKTDTATINSETFADISGLSVTLTPRDASSKFLVIADCKIGCDVNGAPMLKIQRNGTDIYVGDAAGSRAQAGAHLHVDWPINTDKKAGVMVVLDEPATASAVTYKVQWRGQNTNAVYLNKTAWDGNVSNESARDASSLTVLELGA